MASLVKTPAMNGYRFKGKEMAQKKTHLITLVTEKGNKQVKVHGTVGSWVVGAREAYNKDTGLRNGSPTSQRRVLLHTLTEIEVSPAL